MRIIFFGTPQLCIPYLEMIFHEYELIAVVCNPDQPVGRKHILTPPPTKVWAQEHNISVLQPERMRGFANELAQYSTDIYVVVAYGKIIPEMIINHPVLGTLNVHYSLLPRWRGASPVEAAVLAGDTLSGVCVQQMHYELDSGPLWNSEEIPLDPDVFAREIRDGIMGEIGVRLLRETLKELSGQSTSKPKSTTEPKSQIGEPTFCYRIKKEDGELLPTDDDITRWRKYRAYMPWPGVFWIDNEGKRVKVNEARFENNKFIPTIITPESGKPLYL